MKRLAELEDLPGWPPKHIGAPRGRFARWFRPNVLHRQLAERLGIGGLVIAALLGAVVLWSDIGHIKDAIETRARADADWLSPLVPDALDSLDPSRRAALDARLKDYITARAANPEGYFAIAAIYDLSHRLVAESVSPRSAATAGALGFPGHPGFSAGVSRYVAGQLYILVATPLRRPNGAQIGWFEGAYHVPQPAVTMLVLTGLRTSLMVIIAVLATTVLLYPVIAALNQGVFERSLALLHANLGTLEALGSAIAKRDSDTNAHNYRVTLAAVRLAEGLGVSHEQVRALIKGAFLHDVGKLAIPDAVLLKPGSLDPAELAVMKTHVAHGLDIVRHIEWLADAADVVGCHHEWFNGSGYPRGLRGEAIPLVARIFTIADVFDALTSQRPYKPAFALERSLAILEEGRGSHFDPALLDVFLSMAQQLHADLADCDEHRLERRLRSVTGPYFAEALLG